MRKEEGTFTLPTRWCVEDCDIVTEYARKRFNKLIGYSSDGLLCLYVNEYTNDYWFYDPQTHYAKINIEEYTKITLDEFKKHILKENNTVSRKDLGRIHNIACSSWKTKLEKLTSRNPFSGTIELTQSEVDEMFNAATVDQYPILVDIFGEQSKYLNLRTLNGSDFGFYDGDVELLHIRSFGEYTDKGFYLNGDYNWEIVKDDRGEHILLPTRKHKL